MDLFQRSSRKFSNQILARQLGMVCSYIFGRRIFHTVALNIKLSTVNVSSQENASTLTTSFRFTNKSLCLALLSILMVLF